jgi:23S rRNA pseudouridine2605 synthase
MKPNRTPYKKSKKEEKIPQPKSTTRLNKYLANAGLCSRREADEHIKMGLVQVNGKVVLEMGFQVNPKDEVKFDGARIKKNPPVYVLLNKPKGFIASKMTGKIKKPAQELLQKASPDFLLPIGDMGRPTTGLVLLTNDEILLAKLSQTQKIPMVYKITLEKNITETLQKKLMEGVLFQDKTYRFKAITPLEGKPKNELGVEVLGIGPSTLLRIMESVGNKILLLDRVVIGGLTKKELPRGNWRFLTAKEVGFLNMFS